jgi:hypothetical protein
MREGDLLETARERTRERENTSLQRPLTDTERERMAVREAYRLGVRRKGVPLRAKNSGDLTKVVRRELLAYRVA